MEKDLLWKHNVELRKEFQKEQQKRISSTKEPLPSGEAQNRRS